MRGGGPARIPGDPLAVRCYIDDSLCCSPVQPPSVTRKRPVWNDVRGWEMDRQRALELLTSSKPELQARFGVTRLALFGSTARDAATSSSDVDVLVSFDGPATSKRYFGVQFFLEDLLGCPVDLVTEKALRPELRPYIEQEKVHV